MTNNNSVWLITGAGRGLGIDITRAALVAGHRVVATGRDASRVQAVLGEHENLFTVALDVTDPASIETAVVAAVKRFGRIDTLVNNAGNFYAGFFEVISDQQFRAQMETNFFGPLAVTRTVLPVMRAQRSGQIVTISSTAGIVGVEFCAAYAPSKFALEGWMESLTHDIEPFGISTMIVDPGFFRTELLVTGASSIWPEVEIEDYAERTAATVANWQSMDGLQPGDPAKLAAGLVELADSENPPARWFAGADAVATGEEKGALLIAQANAHRELSSSLAHV